MFCNSFSRILSSIVILRLIYNKSKGKVYLIHIITKKCGTDAPLIVFFSVGKNCKFQVELQNENVIPTQFIHSFITY